MLSPDRNECRPCKIKGSSYVKTQVDIAAFRHNNSDRVASRVQGFKKEVPTQKQGKDLKKSRRSHKLMD